MAASKDNAEKCSRIKFEYEGVPYTLEFDRDTIVMTERAYDVSVKDLSDSKIGAIRGVFAGSFLKNHPDTEPDTIDAIWSAMPNKLALTKKLVRSYVEGFNTLVGDPAEGNAISWTAE